MARHSLHVLHSICCCTCNVVHNNLMLNWHAARAWWVLHLWCTLLVCETDWVVPGPQHTCLATTHYALPVLPLMHYALVCRLSVA